MVVESEGTPRENRSASAPECVWAMSPVEKASAQSAPSRRNFMALRKNAVVGGSCDDDGETPGGGIVRVRILPVGDAVTVQIE